MSESCSAVVLCGNAYHRYVHVVGSSESNGSYHFLILVEILRNEPICQNETANFGPTGSSRGGTFYSAFPFHFQPKFTVFGHNGKVTGTKFCVWIKSLPDQLNESY